MNNQYYIMEAPGWNPGFFCCYSAVIGFLDYCEINNPIGYKVFFKQGLYFDEKIGPNWWEYYFDPIKNGQDNENIIHMADVRKAEWCSAACSTMSKERAFELINKYITVKSNIQNKIDKFIEENFKNSYIIGVHYRGTDKASEATRVPFDEVEREILKIIDKSPSNYKIFIATDEQGFLDYMINVFKERIIYTAARRSKNHWQPIHHIGQKLVENRYSLGEEAVIDCYLLSRTNFMIKTYSNLSSSVININPYLPTITLNKSYSKLNFR